MEKTVSITVFVQIFLVKFSIQPPISLPIARLLFLLQTVLVKVLTKVFPLLFLVQHCTTSSLLSFLIQRRLLQTSSLIHTSSGLPILWFSHKVVIPHASRYNPQVETGLKICIVGLQTSNLLASQGIGSQHTVRETTTIINHLTHPTGLTTLSSLRYTMAN